MIWLLIFLYISGFFIMLGLCQQTISTKEEEEEERIQAIVISAFWFVLPSLTLARFLHRKMTEVDHIGLPETKTTMPMPDVKQPKPEADPEPDHFFVHIYNMSLDNTVEMLFYNEEEGKKFIVSEGGFHNITVTKRLLGKVHSYYIAKGVEIAEGMTIVIDVQHGTVSYRTIDERNLTMPNEEGEPSPCKE